MTDSAVCPAAAAFITDLFVILNSKPTWLPRRSAKREISTSASGRGPRKTTSKFRLHDHFAAGRLLELEVISESQQISARIGQAQTQRAVRGMPHCRRAHRQEPGAQDVPQQTEPRLLHLFGSSVVEVVPANAPLNLPSRLDVFQKRIAAARMIVGKVVEVHE